MKEMTRERIRGGLGKVVVSLKNVIVGLFSICFIIIGVVVVIIIINFFRLVIFSDWPLSKFIESIATIINEKILPVLQLIYDRFTDLKERLFS